MQQFQVPQFIEVEDKIFGPLTAKQFVYILGGAGIVVILWVLNLPMIVFLLLAIPIGGFFAALAFLKINEQPLIQVLNNALNHFSNPRLYIWKKEEMQAKKAQPIVQGVSATQLPKLSQRKLQDLAWSLDINEKFKR
jgi:hypothetical protein